MTLVNVSDWQPSPGIRIEGKALEIVKTNASVSISAGPGAGKTELLAARANFLLSTGSCRPPQRILAIAFKVDAARNIENRVRERCDPLHAQRFDSLTLDAFAKRLVDQFLGALPDHLRPSADYSISFLNQPYWNNFRTGIENVCPTVQSFNDKELENIVHKGVPDLCLDDWKTPEQQIQSLWWRQHLDSKNCCLTFDMIKSLAVEILKSRPIILSALRQTYSHVFLDEFQDVTGRQYELIHTCFQSSKSILTAVGDPNQAIMGWAGACEGIFDRFARDFDAENERLNYNFRSNSRIVKLINDLAATIDDEFITIECSRRDAPVPEDPVQGWVFRSRTAEGRYLASFIHTELQNNKDLRPSDFVILAKIRVGDVENRIKTAFAELNLQVRNEARTLGEISLQDLVHESAYSFFLAALKLAVNVRRGTPYDDCLNTIASVEGFDLSNDKGYSDARRTVRFLVDDLKKFINGRCPIEIRGKEIVDFMLAHVGLDKLQRTSAEYKAGNRLKSVVEGFAIFFEECREESESWSDCISSMEGDDSIRLMTIHKSKGLEYHTVFFIEFNDDSFWGNEDDVKVFFVALSRARERVYFSYCEDSKGTKQIKPLWDRLTDAEVPFVRPG